MPVLIEALSVVIRVDRIQAKVPTNSPVAGQMASHPSFCADGELLRLAFMQPQHVADFVADLESLGLRHVIEDADGRRAEDLAVVDQLTGPTVEAPWLEYRHVDLVPDGSQPVATVRLKDGKETRTVFPDGWRFQGSMSQQARFVPGDQADEHVEYLRTENGLDVYRDRKTGRIHYTPERPRT